MDSPQLDSKEKFRNPTKSMENDNPRQKSVQLSFTADPRFMRMDFIWYEGVGGFVLTER